MPLIIPAIIGTVGAVGGSLISSHAIGQASQAATNAANQNNALQSQIYSSNKALEQPYINSGNSANDALQGFLGLGGDPAKSQAALNNYLNSTGYQFNLNQALDGTSQAAAADGILNSGSTIKALQDRGTQVANTYGQHFEQNLQGVVNTGANSANALAGQGQGYANAVSNNNNSAATGVGNAAIARANSTNALIGTAISAYGLSRGQSSFGGGSGGTNAFGNATGSPVGG